MKIHFVQGNAYFDTYHIYNEENILIGIFEHHCRDVKRAYYVSWKLDNPTKLSGQITGTTETFYTQGEAIEYSIGK